MTAASTSVDTSAALDAVRRVAGDETLTGREFCVAYTAAVDAWLSDVFDRAMSRQTSGSRAYALVAVGGHGRGELCPQSDLDLLLLAERSVADDVAEAMWYPLWDARFKVGHAARTVRDTLALSETDIETATAIMSARLVAGDQTLVDALIEGAAVQRAKRARHWLRRLASSTRERRLSIGDVAHELEPDVKEGAGGLRDGHWIDWAQQLGALVADADRQRAEAAYDVVLGVRIELQRLAGRATNRLVLQDQDAVADRLGFAGGAELMNRVSLAARDLSWVADNVLTAAEAPRGRLSRNRYRVLRDDPDLGATISVGPNEVTLSDIAARPVDPRAALRLAVVAAERGLPISRSSLELLRDAPALANPWPADARRLLVRLLMSGSGCVDVIEALDRNDVWTALIPEWEGARCRPQRNPYHRWNVDRHLTETVAKAATLVGRVPRPDLLVLGALLHDIGKGVSDSGLEHAAVGADMAEAIVARIGLDDYDGDVVVSMVRDHLLLPDVATRRDLDDPATIVAVAERVGTPTRLQLLAALAEADGCATGPSAWGQWKSDLVKSLVSRVEASFVSDGDSDADLMSSFADRNPLDPRLHALVTDGEPVILCGDDVLTVCWPDQVGLFASIAGVLALSGMEVLSASVRSVGPMAIDEIRVRTETGDPPDWDRVVSQLRDAFAGKIALRARVTQRALSYRTRRVPGHISEPKVAFEAATDSTIIEVSTPDSVGLLYRLTSSLAELHLDIRRATVATIGPDVVDTFYVVNDEGLALTDRQHMDEIRTALLFAASRIG